MHFSLLVITDKKPNEDELALLMAPFSQNDDNIEQKWDWYQLGGRFTGHFDDYDPQTDPANIEVCKWCQGTGRRDDGVGREMRAENPGYTCNGCQGKGKSVKWPTNWAPHAGDQIQVKDLKQPLKRTHATLQNEGWVEPDDWWRVGESDKQREQEEFDELIKSLPPETWLTIVDYHS